MHNGTNYQPDKVSSSPRASCSPNPKKNDASILIGNALDHYDSAIYGFLAPLLAPIFFPNFDPIVQLILAYSVLTTSMFTRPLGALIFGTAAKKYGAKICMSYSLIGVAACSVVIGFLPGYSSVGYLAPLNLIALRIVKGIFAAGESTIAKMYIMEDKEPKDALKASYSYQSSSMFGTVLASLAVSLVLASDASMWRLCFWIGGLTGIAGYLLRQSSASEGIAIAVDPSPALNFSSFWQKRKDIFSVAMATGFGHITGTIPFVFMNSFVPLITTITLETMMMLNTSLLIVDMILIPLLGRITMRYEGLKVMLTSSIILSLSLSPLFAYLPGSSLAYVVFVRLWVVFWGVIFLCPLNFWFKSLFSPSEQYLFVGVGGALGAATIGRFTTPACLWLWYMSGSSLLTALYPTLILIWTACMVYGYYRNRSREMVLT